MRPFITIAVQKKPRRQKVFEALRDRIVYREYPPSMALSEKELCMEFKVGRNTLREAFIKLQDMNLVNVIPRVGIYVSHIDIEEIRSLFEIRIAMDAFASALAARRITPEKLTELNALIEKAEKLLTTEGDHDWIELDGQFHTIIYEATRNRVLVEILENLRARSIRAWDRSMIKLVPPRGIIDEWKNTYAALERRDAEQAAQCMEKDHQNSVETLRRQLL